MQEYKGYKVYNIEDTFWIASKLNYNETIELVSKEYDINGEEYDLSEEAAKICDLEEDGLFVEIEDDVICVPMRILLDKLISNNLIKDADLIGECF